MNIVITGAAGVLGRALTQTFSGEHAVSPTDIRMAPGSRMIVRADVLDDAAMSELCADVEVVIHLAQFTRQPHLSDTENATLILDTRLKGTYNVLAATAKAGVRRVIHISDLCIFDGYPNGIVVSEDFAPQPDTSAYQQSVYLSDWVAREFARQYPGMIVTLRIGNLVDQGTLSPDTPADERGLDFRDAVAAIEKAMQLESFDGLAHWGLYHLAADRPESRYSLRKITSGQFGFRPVFNFAAWPKGGTA